MSQSCEMGMSDNGRNNVDGCEHYWTCGKPAKFTVARRSPKGIGQTDTMYLCGTHARAQDKILKRLGMPLCEPIKK